MASTEQPLKNLTVLNVDLEILSKNTDHFFLIVVAILIFFMQCGFAFLEAGSVRTKNTVNILLKNLLDLFFGAISYWAIGWGLAYGPGGNLFCGASQFFCWKMEYEKYPKWLFQFIFAATAATVVSGAIAERTKFTAYFVYSMVITSWIYPPVTHWAWSGEGWLSFAGCTEAQIACSKPDQADQIDSDCQGCPGYFKDFAGSGVVHLLAGGCSLIGCCFMGPRMGRFKDGKPVNIPGHSVPLAGLGGFILVFGFLAFNGGSQASISEEGDGGIVALAIVNTILGGSAGGISVLLLTKFKWIVKNFLLRQHAERGKWSFLLTLNGCLAGMVSICAGANVYEPWAALLVGAGAGGVYAGVHSLMIRCHLDDPLDAVAVHAGGGMWGLLCVPFFMSANLNIGERGILFDGDTSHPWTVLGIHCIGIIAILFWSMFWSTLLFGGLKIGNQLRVSEDIERKGMDQAEHGEKAYPRVPCLDGPSLETCAEEQLELGNHETQLKESGANGK